MNSSKRTWRQSFSCNAELLVQLRHRRGWTQNELARASGYCVRLVKKAESGRSISAAAIQDLAAVFSTEHAPIHLEDLICDTVPLARQFIAGIYVHQRNIVSALRHLLDDETVFHLAGNPANLPFAGFYRGLLAVERFFDRLFSVVEVPTNLDYESCYRYVAQGQDVMIWGESWLHPIGAPLELPVQVTQRLTFRRGKIHVFDVLYDTQYAARILKGSQPGNPATR